MITYSNSFSLQNFAAITIGSFLGSADSPDDLRNGVDLATEIVNHPTKGQDKERISASYQSPVERQVVISEQNKQN